MRLLLVEDEIKLAQSIQAILEKNRYQVDVFHNGKDGLDYALSDQYEMIVLDIMLPQCSGLEILQELRKNKILTPVMLLTAKALNQDKVMGLDYGADDYMTKPFDMEEFLARLRAMARRASQQTDANFISYGDLTYDHQKFELSSHGKTMQLTQKEGHLISYLLRNQKAIISKEQIINKVWGMDSSAEHNHVEVYISFLRKKLKSIESEIQIKTIRGIGYSLCWNREINQC